MSDQQAGPPAWPAPTTPEYTAPPAFTKKRKGKVIAGVVAAVVLVAGGLATAKLAMDRSAKGGAATPEAAVQKMVTAIEQNDLLGLVDVLAPWERDFVRRQLTKLTKVAKDNDALSHDADLGHLPGYTLRIDGLKLDSQAVNDHIADVVPVAGTAHFTGNLDQLPVGSRIRDAIATVDPQDRTAKGDVDFASLDESSRTPIATIKQDGRWYVSLFYTVAEGIRRGADAAPPDPAQAVAAQGADSPEAAVEQMIDAIRRVDMRRLIALSPPDEMAVLHDYAPLFLDHVQKQLANRPPLPFTVQGLQFTTQNVEGGKKLIPKAFTVKVTGDNPVTVAYERTGDTISLRVDAGDQPVVATLQRTASGASFVIDGGQQGKITGTVATIDDETFKVHASGTSADSRAMTADVTVSTDGKCIVAKGTSTSDGETSPIDGNTCGTGVPGASAIPMGSLLGKFGQIVRYDRIAKLFDIGVVTTQVGGKWYVSPLRSTGEVFAGLGRVFEGLSN
jgi:hypothetical protein